MPVFRGRNIGERGQRGQRFSRPRSKRGCEHPEKLKRKPEECGPQQIRECMPVSGKLARRTWRNCTIVTGGSNERQGG